jgi:hypothetical protein
LLFACVILVRTWRAGRPANSEPVRAKGRTRDVVSVCTGAALLRCHVTSEVLFFCSNRIPSAVWES